MKEITLETLRLKPGVRLELQSMQQNLPAVEAVFFSALNRQSVFITLPGATAVESGVKQGEKYRVQGSNGVHSFSFETTVRRLQEKPFVHAHLDYPLLVALNE